MRLTAVGAALWLSLLTGGVVADGGHHHGDEKTGERQLKISSMQDAVNAVAFFQRQLRAELKYGDLEKAKLPSAGLADAATSVTELASGGSAQAVKDSAEEVLRITREVSAGSSVEAATKRAEALDQVVAKLAESAGVKIDESYVAQDTSGGSYLPHMDHKPKHGGVFFMASKQYYHLEGTYPSPGEFRLYLYDDHTRPISPQPASGSIEHNGKSYELLPGEGGRYLVTKLEGSPAPPLSVTAKLKLKEPGDKEISDEQFDFDFTELSSGESVQGGSAPSAPVKAKKRTVKSD